MSDILCTHCDDPDCHCPSLQNVFGRCMCPFNLPDEPEVEERTTRITMDVTWWPDCSDHPKDWLAYQIQKEMGDLIGSATQVSHEDIA